MKLKTALQELIDSGKLDNVEELPDDAIVTGSALALSFQTPRDTEGVVSIHTGSWIQALGILTIMTDQLESLMDEEDE